VGQARLLQARASGEVLTAAGVLAGLLAPAPGLSLSGCVALWRSVCSMLHTCAPLLPSALLQPVAREPTLLSNLRNAIAPMPALPCTTDQPTYTLVRLGSSSLACACGKQTTCTGLL
jgi:hypothetical protein